MVFIHGEKKEFFSSEGLYILGGPDMMKLLVRRYMSVLLNISYSTVVVVVVVVIVKVTIIVVRVRVSRVVSIIMIMIITIMIEC